MRKQGTRIVMIMAALATLALVVPASAATVKTKLQIQSLTATGAKGTVKSKEPACKKKRKVTLAFSGEYTTVRVGTAKTNRKGKWTVNATIDDPGVYIVTVKKAKRGDGVKCRSIEKAARFPG